MTSLIALKPTANLFPARLGGPPRKNWEYGPPIQSPDGCGAIPLGSDYEGYRSARDPGRDTTGSRLNLDECRPFGLVRSFVRSLVRSYVRSFVHSSFRRESRRIIASSRVDITLGRIFTSGAHVPRRTGRTSTRLTRYGEINGSNGLRFLLISLRAIVSSRRRRDRAQRNKKKKLINFHTR